MLKPEFIQNLKQINVSKDPEKTKERLRAVWSPLTKAQREEILLLAGLKKPSIERAYKTGMVSAKILAAVAQVLNIDPYYLAGFNDDDRPFNESQDYVSQFLIELGYEPGKKSIVKQRKLKTQPVKSQPTAYAPDRLETTESPDTSAVSEKAAEVNFAPVNLNALSAELSKLLDADAHNKIEGLTEDDMVLMLRSINVQAGYSTLKKERLMLIKQLLLL